jgi:hypothetical protein
MRNSNLKKKKKLMAFLAFEKRVVTGYINKLLEKDSQLKKKVLWEINGKHVCFNPRFNFNFMHYVIL